MVELSRGRSRWTAVRLVLLAILLAACTGTTSDGSGESQAASAGGGGAPSPGGGGDGGDDLPDACALLTPDEIKAIIGQDVKAGESRVTSDRSDCDWNGVDETKGVLVAIMLEPFDAGFWDTAKNAPDTAVIADIGDEALQTAPILGWLYIHKGSILATFSVVSAYDAQGDVLAWQAALGQMAASRLP